MTTELLLQFFEARNLCCNFSWWLKMLAFSFFRHYCRYRISPRRSSRRRSRSSPQRRRRSSTRSRSWSRDEEVEEREEQERRLDRRIKEKEAAYQEVFCSKIEKRRLKVDLSIVFVVLYL